MSATSTCLKTLGEGVVASDAPARPGKLFILLLFDFTAARSSVIIIIQSLVLDVD